MDSLDLLGDGDELELTHDLERVFDITFTDADYASFWSVGDIDDAVWRHLQTKAHGQDRCATASAFYELRRALREVKPDVQIRPSTKLCAFADRPSALTAVVKRHCDLTLRFPASAVASAGGYLIFLSVFLVFPAAVAFESGPAALAVGLFLSLGSIAIWLDPGRFDAVQTVGDAARTLVNQNFAAFLARGACFDRDSVWEAVRAVAADSAGSRADTIERETLILESSRKVA